MDVCVSNSTEPPSVLALRISRAHDNPSPPPQMDQLEAEDSFPTDDAPQPFSNRLIDISQSFDAGPLLEHMRAPIHPIDDPCSPFSPPPPPTAKGAEHQEESVAAQNISHDLISFDQSLVQAVVPEAALPQPMVSVTDGENVRPLCLPLK